MRAVVQNAYGGPEVLESKEIDTPEPPADGVLVRVRAAGLHAGDVFVMRGDPYVARFFAGWPRPKDHVVGLSAAGIVEAVGPKATRFSPGDEVFGECHGSCAEYAADSEGAFALKPANLTFEEAAAVPTSGMTALQGLRDAGKVQPGQHVLVNGASGGVGTFAVQLGKWLGAEVTGVCSTRNVELVRSLGADHAIDYTREDFTLGGPLYDLILDNVGNHSFAECRRALKPTGRHLPNTGNAGLGFIVKAFATSVFVRQQAPPLTADVSREDLETLGELLESGTIAPVIDKTYPLDRTSEALAYVGGGHARGKVVVTI